MAKHKGSRYKKKDALDDDFEVEFAEEFADWLIKVAKRIKLEMEIGQKSHIKVRNDAARAIKKKLADFNSVTRKYEEMEEKKKETN
jgi:hypothetical protein